MITRKLWPKVACASLLIAALSLSACGHGGADDDDDSGSTTAEVTPVTVARVTRGNISRQLALTGSVAAPPNQDIKISALVAGRISELTVAEGDRVTQGQTVARIDDSTYRDQVAQAEAALTQAHANLDNATLALARNENLVNRGIAARKELEDATTAKGVAQASVQQAEAALSIARLQLSRTQITSPIAGIVLKKFASVGEQVDGTGAEPICEVANLNEVEVGGNVAAADQGSLRVGQSIQFTSGAFPGKTFTGRVVAIAASVDPATNAGLVRIRIANPGGLLRSGMFLTAQIPLETHTGVLRVPAQAIYRDEEGQAHVYVVMGDTANSTDVELGIETGEFDEIRLGVKEGDTVVLTGGYGLPDKAKVSVQTAAGQGRSDARESSGDGAKQDAAKP